MPYLARTLAISELLDDWLESADTLDDEVWSTVEEEVLSILTLLRLLGELDEEKLKLTELDELDDAELRDERLEGEELLNELVLRRELLEDDEFLELVLDELLDEVSWSGRGLVRMYAAVSVLPWMARPLLDTSIPSSLPQNNPMPSSPPPQYASLTESPPKFLNTVVG